MRLSHGAQEFARSIDLSYWLAVLRSELDKVALKSRFVLTILALARFPPALHV